MHTFVMECVEICASIVDDEIYGDEKEKCK